MENEQRYLKNIEQFICSREPENRSGILMRDSAKRLGISKSELQQIEKPYSFIYQRLPVEIGGEVLNISSGIVLHNRARGPFKGGIRIDPDVNIWETTELARLMTLKTSLANLELGGGKGGIKVDFHKLYEGLKDKLKIDFYPFMDRLKDHIMREFVDHFIERGLVRTYIPAPDMGSSGAEMMLFYNETHDPAVVTAKPEGIEGWLPGRHEATGFGTAYSTLKYLEQVGRKPSSITVAIQGFGNVGSHAAWFLHREGCKVIAVTDFYGGVYNPDGIDIPEMMEYARENRTIKGYDDKRPIDNEGLFMLDADVLIPAASGRVIGKDNVGGLGVKLVVIEAANMPVSWEAMKMLEKRGLDLLPDNYVNSGGVIASDLEYKQGVGGVRFSREQVIEHIEMKFDTMWAEINERREVAGSFSQAACDVAIERIYKAMRTRSLI
ncbi:MAG: Glu/Leu/Phe/Val dehydrogenase [Candidatus Glassbacteria bacterium]|nr:Glu/Leu/Phe/Val dehydrogenase [Candidatus Glassbacteria bacterium]